jgi:hypothetical protein
MWVDYDVPKWFLTSKNFYRSPFSKCIVVAILKMAVGRIFSMSGINSGHHYLPTYQILMVGRLWCSELIPDIEQFLLVAIFKMATTIPQTFNIVQYHHNLTGRNFSMSGINSGHHYLPTYEILMISDNVEFLRYCGDHFRFHHNLICGYIMMSRIDSWHWTISTGRHFQNGHHNIAKNQHFFAVLWWPFWKWRPVEIVQCRESIRDIIIYPHIKFWWYRTMLNFCDIVVAILKMATQLQLFFLLHCDEWDCVVALPRHKFVTGATLL